MEKPTRRQTQAVHAGVRRSAFGETSEAIFLTQGFVYASAEQAEARFIDSAPDEFIYARYGNPTVRMFEERMAVLEGAEDAFATASGMAAVNASLFAMLGKGDHVVSSRSLFGSCLVILEDILPRFGVDVTFVDGVDESQWRDAIRPGTKVVFLESISNPTLEVIDLRTVCRIAKSVGAAVIVDNVFATPLFQRCLELGADIVVYSTTKHVDGQGRCLGGVVLGTREYIRKTLEPYIKHTGGSMSPFNAWVMLKGLETLELRCNVQADNALALARRFEKHPKLEQMIFPHLPSHEQYELAVAQLSKGGTVFSMVLPGGKDAAFRFLNELKIVRISNNLGDAKSLATHPATTTHQRFTAEHRAKLGISDGMVRISVGLEDVSDLAEDLERALDTV